MLTDVMYYRRVCVNRLIILPCVSELQEAPPRESTPKSSAWGESTRSTISTGRGGTTGISQIAANIENQLLVGLHRKPICVNLV